MLIRAPHSGELTASTPFALQQGNGCPLRAKSGLAYLYVPYEAAKAADPTQSLKAGEKLNAGLLKVAGEFSELPFVDLAQTLTALRSVAPMWHGLAVESVKANKPVSAERNALDLAKVCFKSVFDGELPLELSAPEADAFLAFVADVLVASQGGVLTANQPLAMASNEQIEAIGPYLNLVTGAMNTHDAKSAHSSAKLEVACPVNPKASRFLSGASLTPVISARASGGSLRDAPWLERVNCFRVSVAGKTFSLIEAFCSSGIRAHLRAIGVTAWDALPIATPLSSGGYSGQFVGQTKVKLRDRSVALNLVPSNAMLKATRELGDRIAALTNNRIAELYRDAVLSAVPAAHKDSLAAEFPLEAFIQAAEFTPNQAKLLKAINQALKKLKAPGLPDDALQKIWKNPEPNRLRQGRQIARIPVVSSQPQNCGGAYCAYAGSRGPYRFPAAPAPQVERRGREERSFHVAHKMLAEAISKAIEAQQEYKSLEEKYQIGEKWLPRRVVRSMQRNQVEGSIRQFLGILHGIVKRVGLSVDQRESLKGFETNVVQSYLIYGEAAQPNSIKELAEMGIPLLRSNDVVIQTQFVDAVVARLAGVKN